MNHIFHFKNLETGKHYVYKAHAFGYVPGPVGWMCDSSLPDGYIAVPSPDIIKDEDKSSFDSEESAMEKISLLYGQQSKEIQNVLEASLNYISFAGYNYYQTHGVFPQAQLMEQLCDVLGKTLSEEREILDPDNFCGEDNVQRLLKKFPLDEHEKELLSEHIKCQINDEPSNGLFVRAIRCYRLRNGHGLKVAKSVIDHVRQEMQKDLEMQDSLFVEQETFYDENG